MVLANQLKPPKNMRFIHIKEIKKDDLFYEFSHGEYYKFRALDDVVYNEKNKQWTVNGYWIQENKEIHFLVTEGYEGYGPKLCKSDQE